MVNLGHNILKLLPCGSAGLHIHGRNPKAGIQFQLHTQLSVMLMISGFLSFSTDQIVALDAVQKQSDGTFVS